MEAHATPSGMKEVSSFFLGVDGGIEGSSQKPRLVSLTGNGINVCTMQTNMSNQGFELGGYQVVGSDLKVGWNLVRVFILPGWGTMCVLKLFHTVSKLQAQACIMTTLPILWAKLSGTEKMMLCSSRRLQIWKNHVTLQVTDIITSREISIGGAE